MVKMDQRIKLFMILFAIPAMSQSPYFMSPCMDIMPTDYDSMHGPSNVSSVTLQGTVFNIGNIGLHDQTVVVKIRTILKWTDPRLTSPSKLAKFSYRRLNPEYQACVWKPYVRTINTAGQEEVEKPILLLLDDKGNKYNM